MTDPGRLFIARIATYVFSKEDKEVWVIQTPNCVSFVSAVLKILAHLIATVPAALRAEQSRLNVLHYPH
jgi:hypothetical protein